jgi:WD40 repeat protein
LTEGRSNPFPGLRSFDVQDSHLFFGREGQSDELQRRLSRSRFLAVSGVSGSGKSSLVRAGLLPALHGGWMGSAGSSWKVCVFRPGDDPIGNLARGLARPEALGKRGSDGETTEEETIIETVLRRGPSGLVSAVREARLSENLLIVVDQFEEIFRYESADATTRAIEDAAGFIELLLLATSGDGSIYIVITLRSEFLGRCSRFRGLPEAINESQYLVPRMTREERKRVLLGPVAVGGGRIAARLVQRILNEWGDDPDRLPLVQHALMRAWKHWENRVDGNEGIDFDDYRGLDEALSSHVDSIYEALSAPRQILAKKMFQALTERTREGADIRRPTTIEELCSICAVDAGDVMAVVDEFRQEGRSFLVPPPPERLTPQSRVDVTHESLLIRWGKLQKWLNEETESRRMYVRLAESAVLHKTGQAALWAGADLRPALEWVTRQNPNKAWGRRYHPDYDLAMQFLRDSRSRMTAERTYKIVAVSLLLATAIGLLLWVQTFTSSEMFAKAQALVAEARLDPNVPAQNAILASLSENYHASIEADRVWRRSLALIPKGIIAVKYSGEITSLAFLKSLDLLAVGGSKGVVLLDAHSGKQVAQVEVEGAVKDLAAAPAKALLLILSETDPYLWDARTRQLRKRLRAGNVHSVSLSLDGARVVTGSPTGAARVWDTATGDEKFAIRAEPNLKTVRFSPDGRSIATGGDGLKIWSASTGQLMKKFTGDPTVEWMEWSPDGRHLAVRTPDRRLHLASVAEGNFRTGFEHNGRVNSGAFSGDSTRLVTGTADGLVRLWSVETGVELWRVQHPDAVLSVSFMNGDKSVVSTCADGATRIFDAVTGMVRTVMDSDRLGTIQGEGKLVAPIAATGDPIIATSRSGVDGQLRLWDGLSKMGTRFSVPVAGVPDSIVYTADGSQIALTFGTGRVEMRDARTGSVSRTLEIPDQRLTEFDRTGNLVATSSAGAAIIPVGATGPTTEISDVVPLMTAGLTENGKQLLRVRVDGVIKRWRFLRGRYSSNDNPSDCELYPDRPKDEEFLNLTRPNPSWERVCAESKLDSGTPFSFRAQFAVLSSEGKKLATTDVSGSILLFDLERPHPAVTLSKRNTVLALAISSDGQRVAAASEKGIQIWEPNGKEAMNVETSGVARLAFSPDRRYLAVVKPNELSIWYLREEDLVQETCSLLIRDLGRKEWETITTEPYQKACNNVR